MTDQVTISVITDEVGPDLDEAIRFMGEEGIDTVDIRSIGGANFMSLDESQQKAAARKLRDAGLSVGCLATPLLKWSPPGREAATQGDQFGFDAGGRSPHDLFADAFAAAEILDTRNLRIFSYLAYEGFAMSDLAADLEILLMLAEERGATLHVENEHVCNVATVADLIALSQAHPHPRLRGLLDVANANHAGAPPSDVELSRAMAGVDLIHFKDYSKARHRFVTLGEGDIPLAHHWAICREAAGDRHLTLSIETHVPEAPLEATCASVAALRQLVSAGA